MTILRILLIAMAAILVLLAIVPHTKKEEELEQKAKKILSYALISVSILLVIAGYIFRDSLWRGDDKLQLLASKVRTYNEHSKKLSLSDYELRNISINNLTSFLDSRTNIKHLLLTNISTNYTKELIELVSSTQNISSIKMYVIPPNVFNLFFTELSTTINLKEITIERCNINDENANLLANYLRQSKTIKQLNLIDNSISEIANSMLMDLEGIKISHEKKRS